MLGFTSSNQAKEFAMSVHLTNHQIRLIARSLQKAEVEARDERLPESADWTDLSNLSSVFEGLQAERYVLDVESTLTAPR